MIQLYNFSTSFLIDDDICERVRRLIDLCITDIFQVDFYHIMLDGKQVGGRPGLATPKIAGQPWCNDGADSVPIYASDNVLSYRAQSTYAYQEQRPLWVTSNDGQFLNESDEYIDDWSSMHKNGSNRLPAFRDAAKHDVRTSIIIPLRHGEGHVFGFICLESRKYIRGNDKYSDRAKEQLGKLADSIGAILSAHESYLKRKNSTRNALERLESLAKDYKICSPLSKPIVFFASSSRADLKVVSAIREVLGEFENEFEVRDWRDDTRAGSIPLHIKETISDCTFGICYFSEPAEKEAHSKYNYIDNPNVMFEAGMLNSLVHSVAATPKGWIPIREDNSPPAPFDFAQERMVIVERFENKEVKRDKLITELKDRLLTLTLDKKETVVFTGNTLAVKNNTNDTDDTNDTNDTDDTNDTNDTDDTEAYAIARIKDHQSGQPFYLGRTYELQAGIRTKISEGFKGEPVRLSNQEDPIQLEIVVWAEDMEIQPDWMQPYLFSRTEETSLAEFQLKPTQSGLKQVRVEFLYQRHWLAKIEFEFEVVEAQELVAVS